MYKQLTSAQRYVISALLKKNVSKKEIAEEIGVSLSTVYRELKRNSNARGGYNPRNAHEMALERRERIVTNSMLRPGLLKHALGLLVREQWSPWQISGYLSLRGRRYRTRPSTRRYALTKAGNLPGTPATG